MRRIVYWLLAVTFMIGFVGGARSAPYPTVKDTTSQVLACRSDLECAALGVVHVSRATVGGVTGLAWYRWHDAAHLSDCPEPLPTITGTTGEWCRDIPVGSSSTPSVPFLSDLLTISASEWTAMVKVHLVQYRSGYSQGGGDFVWLPASVASGLTPDNLGLVIAPSDHSGTCNYGCAVRVLESNILTAAHFGCYEKLNKPDGTLNDDTTCLSAMLTAGFTYKTPDLGNSTPVPSAIGQFDLSIPGGTITLRSALKIDMLQSPIPDQAFYITTGGARISVCNNDGGIYISPATFGAGSSGFRSVILDGRNSTGYGADCPDGSYTPQYFIKSQSGFGNIIENFKVQKFYSGVALVNEIVGAAGDNRFSERNVFYNFYIEAVKGCYANVEPTGADISFDDTMLFWIKCNISGGPDAADTIGFNLHGYQGRSIYSGLTVWKRNDATSLQKAFYLDGNFETVTGISWAVDGGSGKLHDIEFGDAYVCNSSDCDTSTNLTLTVAPSWTDGEGKLALPDGWESKLNVMVKQTNMGKLVVQNQTNWLSTSGRYRISSDAGYMEQSIHAYFNNGTAGVAQFQTLTLYGAQKIHSWNCSIGLNSADQTAANDAGASFCGLATVTSNTDDTITVQVYRIPGPSGRGAHVSYNFKTDRN